ncbi:ABC transporter ATP-binding protein [Pseudoalteromonas sp. PPB1]|uniref:ABC transporter ATP-binding protein n=1 Tax=Pseudoalteromonas sp. PPB1 TaxID=2756136 RepID=UPI001890DA20|nr:ABC transporter ATP-binding protein [Pseudoalteromonas sp. PPB1]
MTEASIIELKKIQKIFLTDEVETHALSDISLSINKGDFVSITGPSGGGKSTLLSLMGLLDTFSGGEYKIAGYDTKSLSNSERSAIRNKEIGFIFQSFNLISDLSVEDNVELPLDYRHDINKTERAALVSEALKKVGMEHRAKHFPSQLSGGQQQRVAIARAIAGSPTIILADEPTGNLDSKNASAIMDLLLELNKAGATICMVTHDPKSAAMTKRVINILDGKLVSDEVVKTPEKSLGKRAQLIEES